MNTLLSESPAKCSKRITLAMSTLLKTKPYSGGLLKKSVSTFGAFLKIYRNINSNSLQTSNQFKFHFNFKKCKSFPSMHSIRFQQVICSAILTWQGELLYLLPIRKCAGSQNHTFGFVFNLAICSANSKSHMYVCPQLY